MLNDLKKYLNKTVFVKVDRPLGSLHEKYKRKYEVNYGYVPDTLNEDGEEIDAYVLGVDKAVSEFTGKCTAIIHRLDDNDDKLVIIPEKMKDISDDEILKLTFFQEKYFNSVIIRR